MNDFSPAVHHRQNQLLLLTLALLHRVHKLLNRQRFALLNAQDQVLSGILAESATFIDAKVYSRAEAFPDDVASASQISVNQVVDPGVLFNGFVASEKTLEICLLALTIFNFEQVFVLKIERFVKRKREHFVLGGAVSSLGKGVGAAFLSYFYAFFRQDALSFDFRAVRGACFFAHKASTAHSNCISFFYGYTLPFSFFP